MWSLEDAPRSSLARFFDIRSPTAYLLFITGLLLTYLLLASKQASKLCRSFERCAISRGLGAGDADRRLLRRWSHRDGRRERYGGRSRRRRRPHMDEDRYRPRRTPVPQACITYLWRSRRCSRRSARPSRTPAAPPPPQELHDDKTLREAQQLEFEPPFMSYMSRPTHDFELYEQLYS